MAQCLTFHKAMWHCTAVQYTALYNMLERRYSYHLLCLLLYHTVRVHWPTRSLCHSTSDGTHETVPLSTQVAPYTVHGTTHMVPETLIPRLQGMFSCQTMLKLRIMAGNDKTNKVLQWLSCEAGLRPGNFALLPDLIHDKVHGAEEIIQCRFGALLLHVQRMFDGRG